MVRRDLGPDREFAPIRFAKCSRPSGAAMQSGSQLSRRPELGSFKNGRSRSRELAGHELECAGDLVRLMLIAAVAVVVQPQASQSHPRIRMGPPEPYRSPSILCSETLSIRKSAAGAAVALVATASERVGASRASAHVPNTANPPTKSSATACAARRSAYASACLREYRSASSLRYRVIASTSVASSP
jgi:hypothetical protein